MFRKFIPFLSNRGKPLHKEIWQLQKEILLKLLESVSSEGFPFEINTIPFEMNTILNRWDMAAPKEIL